MRFEFCLAVLLTSLVDIAVGSNVGDGSDRRTSDVHVEILQQELLEDERNWNGDIAETRSKSSLLISERDTVEFYFNYQRSIVGASDMNYVRYDAALETSLDVWTNGCNYDAPSSLPNNIRAVKYSSSSSYPDHKEVMRYAFNLYSAFYAMRSIYVTGVAASVKYCPTLTINGQQYNMAYLSLYGVSAREGFNDTVQQYIQGRACKRCQSNVNWCYNDLCIADCSFYIDGCCQISSGLCAATSTPADRCEDSGAHKVQSDWTGILYGLLIILCYCFQ